MAISITQTWLLPRSTHSLVSSPEIVEGLQIAQRTLLRCIEDLYLGRALAQINLQELIAHTGRSIEVAILAGLYGTSSQAASCRYSPASWESYV